MDLIVNACRFRAGEGVKKDKNIELECAMRGRASARQPGAELRRRLRHWSPNRDELMADWTLALSGQTPYKIDPLR